MFYTNLLSKRLLSPSGGERVKGVLSPAGGQTVSQQFVNPRMRLFFDNKISENRQTIYQDKVLEVGQFIFTSVLNLYDWQR